MPFGNFGGWSPRDHALNKMVYDEAHKNGGGSGGGGNNNSDCTIVFVIMLIIIGALLFWR